MRSRHLARLIQSLYAANLSLSDTQLITALAFSIAVYIKQCTLSVYHFQVSSWLQTVLLVTALASSSALIFASSWNDLSRKNWRINRRYLLGHIARIAVVCGIFATGSAYIGISSSTPAGLPDFPSPAMATNSICYYKDNTPKGAEIFAGSYWGSKGPMICLAVSFGTLLIFCVMSVWRNRKGIHRSKSSQLDRRLSMKFPTNSRSHRFFKFFFLSGFVLYILYVIPMAIAGVVVYNLHVKAARLMTVDQSEDRWTFGQIIPTIILVLPFLSFCETLLGKQIVPCPA